MQPNAKLSGDDGLMQENRIASIPKERKYLFISLLNGIPIAFSLRGSKRILGLNYE